MFLSCVNGGAIGIQNTLLTLVVKELYGEKILVDLYILGSCLYGFGETVVALQQVRFNTT